MRQERLARTAGATSNARVRRYHGKHERHQPVLRAMGPQALSGRRMVAPLAGALSLIGGLSLVVGAPAANASTLSIGNRILNMAQTRTGDWYVYGAAGPNTFDCSGLVYWASHRLGVNMPRTTYEMVTQGVRAGILVRTYHPHRGDLAFFGPVGAPYHVEFVTVWSDTTYGALDSGTRVGWHRYWPGSWAPSAFYTIR